MSGGGDRYLESVRRDPGYIRKSEIQALELASRGYTYAQIARRMSKPGDKKTIESVNWALRLIRVKLGATNTIHAVRIATERGLFANTPLPAQDPGSTEDA